MPITKRSIKSPPKPRPTTTIDAKGLNERLAKFIGFKYEESSCNCDVCKSMCWIAPNAKLLTKNYKEHCSLPNFTDSLDVCFKYLIPKLKELGYMARIQYSPLFDNDTGKKLSDWTYCVMLDQVLREFPLKRSYLKVNKESPALCLCSAISNLIDDMEKK